MNAVIALDLLIKLLGQADAIARLINAARAEGRDVTDAELNALVAKDDAAKAALQAAIEQARTAGR